MTGLSKIKTNTSKETEGVWIELPDGENEDKTIPAFKLSRLSKSNVEYSKALEKATRPYRRQIQLKTMKEELSEKIFLEVFCVHILKDWRNVQDEDGNEIQYSKEAAIELLTTDGMEDLYDRLTNEANEAANFRDAVQEEEAKN